ncbi:hypothetical protein V5O48_014018 [Marasmius crinis-equi]|uniref:Uncharacterized protein n=1 Tax=Marasmius crinis-equi TaxID=585013 RepID=A0ABR3EYH1_9AGAR
MAPPIFIPSSPKRVLVIGDNGITRLEAEISEQARHVQNILNSWLPGAIRASKSPKQLVDMLEGWEGLARISEDVRAMGDGYSGFYFDVRSGERNGLYCSSREAFLSMSEIPRIKRRAFAFEDFRGAFLSVFMRPGGPPGHRIYDYCPVIVSPEQNDIAIAMMLGLRPDQEPPTIGPPSRLPLQSVAVPSGSQPAGSQEPGDLAALMYALESSFGWARYYLYTHGFGAELNWIQDRFDLADDLDDFVGSMTNRFGEAKFSEYVFIYSLFKEL